jgi:antitoxin component of RelBE/YafQ-DinJ toxin-antitoxin module
MDIVTMAKKPVRDKARSAILNVRIRPELKAQVERIADQDNRTLSNFIEVLLEQTVKERGGK